MEIDVGRADTFFLDGAVRRFEERVRALRNPMPQFAFAYGATDGHCWSGDHEHLNAYSGSRTMNGSSRSSSRGG